MSELFDNYTSVARPALNDKDAVNVTLGLSLSQIINVVSFSQVFSVLISFWFYLNTVSLRSLTERKSIIDVWQPQNYSNHTG